MKNDKLAILGLLMGTMTLYGVERFAYDERPEAALMEPPGHA